MMFSARVGKTWSSAIGRDCYMYHYFYHLYHLLCRSSTEQYTTPTHI